jgi:ubiquinone/menaquinone biosynthesis C-methylase UbiE
MMTSWIDYWSRPNALYANRRNLEAHFTRIWRDLQPLLADARPRSMLDWGCGEALAAERIAGSVERLYLYDGVDSVRDKVRARTAGVRNITVLDPAELAALPPSSIDMVMVNSVVQYLDEAAMAAALTDWWRLLGPGGRLLLTDLIDPDTGMVDDAKSQLRFAATNGFLTAALFAIVRLVLSDYSRVRRAAGFSTYRPAEILTVLDNAGFAGERLPSNVGPTTHRFSVMGRRMADPQQEYGAAAGQ